MLCIFVDIEWYQNSWIVCLVLYSQCDSSCWWLSPPWNLYFKFWRQWSQTDIQIGWIADNFVQWKQVCGYDCQCQPVMCWLCEYLNRYMYVKIAIASSWRVCTICVIMDSYVTLYIWWWYWYQLIDRALRLSILGKRVGKSKRTILGIEICWWLYHGTWPTNHCAMNWSLHACIIVWLHYDYCDKLYAIEHSSA